MKVLGQAGAEMPWCGMGRECDAAGQSGTGIPRWGMGRECEAADQAEAESVRILRFN